MNKVLNPYCIPSVYEAGCDEAGRGPLAGSVFAAAVILPQDIADSSLGEHLNDSKQLSEKAREQLRVQIEQQALAWAVGEVTAQEIDQINILQAAILAMHRALAQLTIQPEHIIVDGNKWKPYIPQDGLLAIPARTIVKGDATYMSIAAASILAKTYRDAYMLRLDAQFPMYHWAENKGYPTAAHYEAIKQYGISPYHRRSFRLR